MRVLDRKYLGTHQHEGRLEDAGSPRVAKALELSTGEYVFKISNKRKHLKKHRVGIESLPLTGWYCLNPRPFLSWTALSFSFPCKHIHSTPRVQEPVECPASCSSASIPILLHICIYIIYKVLEGAPCLSRTSSMQSFLLLSCGEVCARRHSPQTIARVQHLMRSSFTRTLRLQ